MAGYDLNLCKWDSDGTDRLAFFDSLHGDDAIFVLGDNGESFRVEIECRDDGTLSDEIWTPVDLLSELKSLLRKLEHRQNV